MTRLNEVRDDRNIYNNRLDTTLADVFNLLSLFYLTIGKTRECPATYSQIASMRVSPKRLLRLTRHRVARLRSERSPSLLGSRNLKIGGTYLTDTICLFDADRRLTFCSCEIIPRPTAGDVQFSFAV